MSGSSCWLLLSLTECIETALVFVVSASGPNRTVTFLRPPSAVISAQREAGSLKNSTMEGSASCGWPTYIQTSAKGNFQEGLDFYGDTFHWASCWILLSLLKMIQKKGNHNKRPFCLSPAYLKTKFSTFVSKVCALIKCVASRILHSSFLSSLAHKPQFQFWFPVLKLLPKPGGWCVKSSQLCEMPSSSSPHPGSLLFSQRLRGKNVFSC